MLSHDKLLSRLHYNPETGVFTWLKASLFAPYHIGCVAGCIKRRTHNCYREIVISKRVYQAHRLAFFYMIGRWPRKNMDHKDRNGLNNKWSNLREATLSQNGANACRYSTNTSGFKGVTFHKKCGKWQSAIKKDSKSIYIGLFDTPDAAHLAYVAKAKELFGEFARAA